jgi:hypothetical protein
MRNRFRYLVLLAVVGGSLKFSLLSAQIIPANDRDENQNSRVLVEGWKPLFNGKTLAGWRTYQNKPADSWGVKDGMLYNKGNGDPQTKHADLITEKQYEDFELSLDWKIAPAANSGILYMVTEEFAASSQSGPEYQLIDDKGYPAKLENWQKTAANYAMDPPLLDATKPAGEWNHTVIKVFKGHVEHWLNDKKIVAYDLWSESWIDHKSKGKWKDTPGYGIAKKGHIAIQDHGGEAWFKEIKIREL